MTKYFNKLSIRQLKYMISAISYGSEETLKKLGENPEQLRKDFNERVEYYKTSKKGVWCVNVDSFTFPLLRDNTGRLHENYMNAYKGQITASIKRYVDQVLDNDHLILCLSQKMDFDAHVPGMCWCCQSNDLHHYIYFVYFNLDNEKIVPRFGRMEVTEVDDHSANNVVEFEYPEQCPASDLGIDEDEHNSANILFELLNNNILVVEHLINKFDYTVVIRSLPPSPLSPPPLQ